MLERGESAFSSIGGRLSSGVVFEGCEEDDTDGEVGFLPCPMRRRIRAFSRREASLSLDDGLGRVSLDPPEDVFDEETPFDEEELFLGLRFDDE